MKKENNPVSQEKFKTLIGGQALIEGIMMQGPDKRSIVVRGPEGLVKKVEPLKKRTGIAKWPLIRGVVNFGSSMYGGVKALMYSADFFPEEEGEPSKLDLWLEKKLGSEKLQKLVVALAVVLLAVVSALCFYLPKNQSGALTVVIDISGQEVRRVPLSDFTEATVTSRGYTLHIAAEGGAVSVTDSDCPTQDCVHTGAISRAGQSIVCLPAQVVVHLEGASAPDAPDVIVG